MRPRGNGGNGINGTAVGLLVAAGILMMLAGGAFCIPANVALYRNAFDWRIRLFYGSIEL